MVKNTFITHLLLSLLGLIITTTHASTPVWTLTPLTPTALTLSSGESAEVQYQIQNQSLKTKRIVMLPQPGITQSAPCVMAPREQAGSTCVMSLTIIGSAIPTKGINTGPTLCVANSNNLPNLNQCYRAAINQQLHVKRAESPPISKGHLVLSEFGSSITELNVNSGNSGVLTLTNSGGAPVTHLMIVFPFGWQSYFTTNCPETLRAAQSCTIRYTIPTVAATGIFNPLTIKASNADNELSIFVNIQTVGAAQCWGDNSFAQLGNGSNFTSNIPVPVDSTLLGQNLTAITAGFYHSCALGQNKQVMCWGDNSVGQLGNGNNTSSNTPISVNTAILGQDVVAITAGSYHSCALKENKQMMCWGDNSLGQLGNGDTTNSNTPVLVDTTLLGQDVVAITAGLYHTCALKQNGQVMCWGANTLGQLGNGDTINSNTPVLVDTTLLGQDVVAITAGEFHCCALKQNGQMMCWGDNFYGQLGNGSFDFSISTPTPVDTTLLGQDVVAITAGSYHSCALKENKQMMCWGENTFGQLGNGDNTISNTPVAVDATLLGEDIVTITAMATHTCALKQNGQMMCWGNNIAGQLGDSTFTNSNTPVSVCSTSGCASNLSVLALVNHGLGRFSCALTPNS